MIEKLHLKAVCSRWIPHRLTDNHKIQRVEEAQNLIVNLSGNTIVVDEKWLFAYPVPARPHYSSWIGPIGGDPGGAIFLHLLHPQILARYFYLFI